MRTGAGISQENQVGGDGKGGIIIFIAWIKFFAFEKHFPFASLVVIILVALAKHLNVQ